MTATLFLMVGLPGSGKTTLAKQLGVALRAVGGYPLGTGLGSLGAPRGQVNSFRTNLFLLSSMQPPATRSSSALADSLPIASRAGADSLRQR